MRLLAREFFAGAGAGAGDGDLASVKSIMVGGIIKLGCELFSNLLES